MTRFLNLDKFVDLKKELNFNNHSTSTMIKSLLSLFICFSTSLLFSQDYSYSFQGKLSPENESFLLDKVGSVEGVEYCKLRYKSDSERGEIILSTVKKEVSSEDQEVFNPAAIKAILVELELEPIEFRTIK